MKSISPDLLGIFGADLSLEIFAALVEKGIFTKTEASDLLKNIAKKNEALSKETATNANKEIAFFALGVASEFQDGEI